MSDLSIRIGDAAFGAKFETEIAPRTCQEFAKKLPFITKIVHVRWSGFAMWIPLSDLELDTGYENPVSYPAPGQFLFYPGGVSQPEILVPYGPTKFASKAGQLAGNHFITIVSDIENLKNLGDAVLWGGAMEIGFSLE